MTLSNCGAVREQTLYLPWMANRSGVYLDSGQTTRLSTRFLSVSPIRSSYSPNFGKQKPIGVGLPLPTYRDSSCAFLGNLLLLSGVCSRSLYDDDDDSGGGVQGNPLRHRRAAVSFTLTLDRCVVGNRRLRSVAA